MRLARTALLCACAGFLSSCASMPQLGDGGAGLPLGRTGWQLSGGVDFGKQVYFVCFVRPFGAKEKAVAESFAK